LTGVQIYGLWPDHVDLHADRALYGDQTKKIIDLSWISPVSTQIKPRRLLNCGRKKMAAKKTAKKSSTKKKSSKR
jgi:hypothetical protein